MQKQVLNKAEKALSFLESNKPLSAERREYVEKALLGCESMFEALRESAEAAGDEEKASAWSAHAEGPSVAKQVLERERKIAEASHTEIVQMGEELDQLLKGGVLQKERSDGKPRMSEKTFDRQSTREMRKEERRETKRGDRKHRKSEAKRLSKKEAKRERKEEQRRRASLERRATGGGVDGAEKSESEAMSDTEKASAASSAEEASGASSSSASASPRSTRREESSDESSSSESSSGNLVESASESSAESGRREGGDTGGSAKDRCMRAVRRMGRKATVEWYIK